jgi:D-alanine-D-alanine ligase
VTVSFRVAVVAGGASAEAAVSRASAAGVARALGEAGHRATVVELDRGLAGALATDAFDVVFPAVHGRLGEDGSLQGLLEVFDVPYVGSGVLASALAMSKPHAKVQFQKAGLPLARDAQVSGRDFLGSARRVRAELGGAIVVKPPAGGSAIGVELLGAGAPDEAVAAALERVLATDAVAFVEELKAGKETTCSVLENDAGVAEGLPPTLILPKAGAFYDFKSKYGTGGSAHVCPAPFSPSLTKRIQEAATVAHRALGCRDLSRVDFVVDDASETFTVLEVNTLPGMTATSLFPEAAAAAGIPFPKLCDLLVRRAAARPRSAAPDVVPMPA